MTTCAPVSMTCPHCSGRFLESAMLVRRGGSAWCPDCETIFGLDGADESIRQSLDAAKAARRRRKARRAEARALWAEPARAAGRPPLMGDILGTLDALLARLERLSRRAS